MNEPKLDFHTEQIRRLTALSFFPTDPAGAKELINALKCAKEESTAITVIEDFLTTCQNCPTPADIRRAIFARQEEPWEQTGPSPGKTPYCLTCKGNGMVKQDGKWDRCACLAGEEYPQSLIDLQNAYGGKKPPSQGKSEKESRRYVDRVLR